MKYEIKLYEAVKHIAGGGNVVSFQDIKDEHLGSYRKA